MAAISMTGAAPTNNPWFTLSWKPMEKLVNRMQMRIAKAARVGRWGKVKALQWLLAHSFYAKLLAVKRVTTNQGKNTAGVDGKIWRTKRQKMRSALSLTRKGYKTLPLRRIYIPKANGKKRPLSIPVMKDRAMQALYLMCLEPVAEMLLDKNAYGFRPKRSTADAIEQCFKALALKNCAQWVLEGDIKSCFDTINHTWLLDNIPMDKVILNKWLTAGFIESNQYHQMLEGTPQGGVISPTLMNLTLAGLEEAIKKSVKSSDKVNIIIYADDFVVTGASKEVLENKVKPAIVSFLAVRGLQLSEEKTKITHIDDGFDFLGFNVRKYKRKLLIKPSKGSVEKFIKTIRETIKINAVTKTEKLIYQLNEKLRGWTNYFSHVVAKRTFSFVDYCIYLALQKWIKKRHPKKCRQWHKEKYFCTKGGDNWAFFASIKDKDGKKKQLYLIRASETPIVRHIKIRADATPYDSEYRAYFSDRMKKRKKGSNRENKRDNICFKNDSWVKKLASEKLEPVEGKLSRRVLMGGDGSNAVALPDKQGVASDDKAAVNGETVDAEVMN